MAEFDGSYDVIVVGSGGGALVGAITAGSKGLDVLVLEKANRCGGVSAYSGAGHWVPGTDFMQDDDSADDALAYIDEVVEDPAKQSMHRAYVATAGPMIDFLSGHEPIVFEALPFPDYFDRPHRRANGMGRHLSPKVIKAAELGETVMDKLRPSFDIDRRNLDDKRDVLWGGQALIGRYLKTLEAMPNVTIWTESPFTDLIDNDGAVAGVVATHDGQTVRLEARKGVLIAAGGFESNAQLRQEFGTVGRAEHTAAPTGMGTGDWLAPAKRLGAGTDHMDKAWKAPGILVDDGTVAAPLFIPNGGVFVNASGRRFTNEAKPYDQFGQSMAEELEAGNDGNYWWIMDSRQANPPGALSSVDAIAPQVEAGAWKQADTVEELAEVIGVEAGQLQATIDRYNEAAESGTDPDFNRGQDPFDLFFAGYQGANRALPPIATPPYVAAPLVLGDLGTKGGLTTDENGQVQTTDGAPIAGLYAAGNSMAPMTNNTYPGPGFPIGTCSVFSYRAVHHMNGEALPAQ